MKRANFPSNKQLKLKGAIERLEKRLKLSDKEIVKDAVRFKKIASTPETTKNYREEMTAHLAHLKTLVK